VSVRYTEAINVLYSGNLFDPLHPGFVRYLPLLIPLRQMNSICSLQTMLYVPWLPDASKESKRNQLYSDWMAIWQNISSMQSLRRLVVKIEVRLSSLGSFQENEIDVLQPIKTVTRPEVFNLIIPWKSGKNEALLDGFPCKIIRYTKDVAFKNEVPWDWNGDWP
jgi:hypothetical protein